MTDKVSEKDVAAKREELEAVLDTRIELEAEIAQVENQLRTL